MRLIIIFLAVVLFAKNEDFLKTLNEVSEIATESKLNIDKTPSNVDVINRDFIIKSGAKTLIDLLKYLPSIEISMTPSGKKQLIIRGNKSAFRDKIKLMINGVEVTNNLYNNQFYYYNFPASLIKRIEFTKTPDSILYGENAFLGVLNIITLDRLDENQFSVYGGTKDEVQFSFFKKFSNILIDGYYSYSYPKIYSPQSIVINFSKKRAFPFREDGIEINSLEKNAGVGIRCEKENSILSYRINYYKKGNFYGIENIPPLKRDRYVEFYHQFLEYRFSKYLKYNFKEELKFGIKNYIWNGSYRVMPYDLNPSTTNDVIAGAKIPEYEIYLKNLFKYDGKFHNLNFILDLKYAKPYDFYYYQYIEGITPKIKTSSVLKKGINRKAIGVGAEDLYILNENLSFIFGYRKDFYNDFGNKNSYKIGGVYNINETTTFKLLYNNAFRVPSWIELYAKTMGSFNGNENLKPETISMWEAIFLKTFKNDKLKVIFYKGKNKNFIGRKLDVKSGKKIYDNLGDYDINGIEISYKKLFKKFKYYISYSINKNRAKVKSTSNFFSYDYSGVRKRWIKGWGNYKIGEFNNIFVSFMYGSKIKMPNYVEDIDNYFELDANYIYKKENSSVILGIKNITNHKNYMPVFPSEIINKIYSFEYEGAKIPYIGRKIYFEVVKQW